MGLCDTPDLMLAGMHTSSDSSALSGTDRVEAPSICVLHLVGLQHCELATPHVGEWVKWEVVFFFEIGVAS